MLKDDCTLLSVVKLPDGLLALSILTSQQGNYPFYVASDKKMYLMEKNEDKNGDFVFSEIVSSHPHSPAKAYDGPGNKAKLTSVGGIYSLGNALIFTDGNCPGAFSPTKEQVKMM